MGGEEATFRTHPSPIYKGVESGVIHICFFFPQTRTEITQYLFSFFQKYIENVKQDTNIGTNILRVSASDEDADNNGAIRYSLTAPFDPKDLNYFDIQPESGWIYLRKALDVSVNFYCAS